MNKYVRPDRKKYEYETGQYILNGQNNSYYTAIENLITGSKTNQAIIAAICSYTYGAGLYDRGLKIKNIISNDDVDALIQDYKSYGNAAVFIHYNWDNTKVIKIEHTPISCVGVANNQDITTKPDYYWWSFDWTNRTKYQPQLYPAFGYQYGAGTPASEKEKTEILFIKRGKPKFYFAEPDWESVECYAQWEQEFGNMMKNRILDNFALQQIITLFGVDDVNKEAAYKNLKKTYGGSNGESWALIFADNANAAPKMESVKNAELPAFYEFVSDYAESALLMGHRFPPILLGAEGATGFADDAKLMNTALRLLYRDVINKIREKIIDSLEEILQINDPLAELNFKDFPDLILTSEQTPTV
jgi:hypothetical protein